MAAPQSLDPPIGGGRRQPSGLADDQPHASPSKPNHKFDFTAVGTDLVRVVLEAIFDAYEGLPAVSSASGAGLLPAIPVDVDAGDLNHMNRVNDNAEVATAVVVDRVVKGIGARFRSTTRRSKT